MSVKCWFDMIVIKDEFYGQLLKSIFELMSSSLSIQDQLSRWNAARSRSKYVDDDDDDDEEEDEELPMVSCKLRLFIVDF